jgi:hypothetical protein
MVTFRSMCTVMGYPTPCTKIDETTFIVGAPVPLRYRLAYAGTEYTVTAIEEDPKRGVWELTVEKRGR